MNPYSVASTDIITKLQDNPYLVDPPKTQVNIMKTQLHSNKKENPNPWNKLFQRAYDKLTNIDNEIKKNGKTHYNIESKIKIYESLCSLARNFTYTAELYGKIIISEHHLPISKKTIKPCNLSGIIGGTKFIVQGILFKFAIDSSHFLRGDGPSIKIASHELKSLDCLMNCRTKGLHFPLLAIIDYRGYRLIAMSTLPIDSNTLKFGSSDAGNSVHNEIPELNKLVSETCNKLNLKQHFCGKPPNTVLVPGPVDLECHLGSDGKYYIIDFSRLFPPDLLSKGVHCCSLFRLLRPEFVKSYKIPLCSDSFSNFVKYYPIPSKEHAIEIKDAHYYLREEIIPKFCLILQEQDSKLFNSDQLIHSMHREGINIRYLGLIRKNLLSSCSPLISNDKIENLKNWSNIILIEIISRIIKWQIRKILRTCTENSNLDIPSSYFHKVNVVRYLNIFFGIHDQIHSFWKYIVDSVLFRFPLALSTEEINNPKENIRDFIIFHSFDDLIKRIHQISGFSFTSIALHRLLENKETKTLFQNCKDPFDVSYIDDFHCRVKQLSLIEQTNGFLQKSKAKFYKSQNILHYDNHLLQLSLSSFEKALESNPSDKISLIQCGKINFKLNNIEIARIYFSFALRLGDDDLYVLYSYARFLHKLNSKEEKQNAETYYIKVIKSNNDHFKAIYYYACLLHELNPIDDKLAVKQLFERIETYSDDETLKQKIKNHPANFGDE